MSRVFRTSQAGFVLQGLPQGSSVAAHCSARTLAAARIDDGYMLPTDPTCW